MVEELLHAREWRLQLTLVVRSNSFNESVDFVWADESGIVYRRSILPCSSERDAIDSTRFERSAKSASCVGKPLPVRIAAARNGSVTLMNPPESRAIRIKSATGAEISQKRRAVSRPMPRDPPVIEHRLTHGRDLRQDEGGNADINRYRRLDVPITSLCVVSRRLHRLRMVASSVKIETCSIANSWPRRKSSVANFRGSSTLRRRSRSSEPDNRMRSGSTGATVKLIESISDTLRPS